MALKIDWLLLVTELVAQQFPKWAHLEIKPVELSGIDNRTFRLGKEMLIRLPSVEDYALQVLKEQKWLEVLAPHLSFSIPKPLAMGQPSKHYPWNWSIYKEGNGSSSLYVLISPFYNIYKDLFLTYKKGALIFFTDFISKYVLRVPPFSI